MQNINIKLATPLEAWKASLLSNKRQEAIEFLQACHRISADRWFYPHSLYSVWH